MLLVREIRLPLSATQADAVAKALYIARLSPSQVAETYLHKLSVDARHTTPLLVYTIALRLHSPQQQAGYIPPGPQVQLVTPPVFSLRPGCEALSGPVIVCGFGPAGLFAALELAQAGFSPIVIERGPALAQRREALAAFEAGGVLDPEANIQFGEGGAGTFSDGKLTSRIKDPICAHVMQRFLDAGAPPELAFHAKPHIGTNLLQGVLTRMREELEQMGGRVLFGTKLTGYSLSPSGALSGIETTQGAMPCGALVLAIGHSARDTFTMLADNGLPLEAKSFAVGFRIEHLQSDIDAGLYHAAAGHPALPPGEYQLATREAGRGVYTFCMCPGGSVVAASSEEGGVVTNGMSFHERSGPNANAAVVANVSPEDFGPGPFAGVNFQRKLEQAAYIAGGHNYTAPAQSLDGFFAGKIQPFVNKLQPTYPLGVSPANLSLLLPENISKAISAGIRTFGRKLPGYAAGHAILTGVETRTSSPIRIPRTPTAQSTHLPGLWPCGEGAGYAGGIISAAVDGVRTASAIIEKYAPTQK